MSLSFRGIFLSDQNVKTVNTSVWSSELHTKAAQDVKNKKAEILNHHNEHPAALE